MLSRWLGPLQSEVRNSRALAALGAAAFNSCPRGCCPADGTSSALTARVTTAVTLSRVSTTLLPNASRVDTVKLLDRPTVVGGSALRTVLSQAVRRTLLNQVNVPHTRSSSGLPTCCSMTEKEAANERAQCEGCSQ